MERTQIAEAFLDLHEKREQADYDHAAIFTRPDTLGPVALARQVVGHPSDGERRCVTALRVDRDAG